MNLMKSLENRYSTKVFDKTKMISKDHMTQVERLLQMSPSSTNIQPWKFVIADTEAGKKRISKAAQGFYIFNEQKVLDASTVVVFASKTDINEDFLHHILEKEDQDGRFALTQHKADTHGARSIFVNMHKYDYKDVQHWAEKQVYLNLGNFLLGLAQLGIDAIAMEGLDMKILDEEFGLRAEGYTSSIVVALGYGHPSDFNATLPKSRRSLEDIIIKA